MIEFGIKDVIDIIIIAVMLFYIYKMMKSSGAISLFYGVLIFFVIWIIASEILDMRLTGSIMDKFMGIGLIVLVVIFQDQIKRFLSDIGSHGRFHIFRRFFRHDAEVEPHRKDISAVVFSCMTMSKSKTGALIVIQRKIPLTDYEATGDIIDADINVRLIENIFFKNSPLHDGAMIIADNKIKSVGCILPVSRDMDIPKNLGLRHRAALGMSQTTDAVCVVVSEETGGISVAIEGKFKIKLTAPELDHILSEALSNNK